MDLPPILSRYTNPPLQITPRGSPLLRYNKLIDNNLDHRDKVETEQMANNISLRR